MEYKKTYKQLLQSYTNHVVIIPYHYNPIRLVYSKFPFCCNNFSIVYIAFYEFITIILALSLFIFSF